VGKWELVSKGEMGLRRVGNQAFALDTHGVRLFGIHGMYLRRHLAG
jgi:hypothetical protein